jgi:hypothetical protein
LPEREVPGLQGKVEISFGISEEHGTAVITTLGHVVGETWDNEARATWHRPISFAKAAIISRIRELRSLSPELISFAKAAIISRIRELRSLSPEL